MNNKKLLTGDCARLSDDYSLFFNRRKSVQLNLRKIVIIALLFSLLQQYSMGQTGQWKLAGNSLTGTEKLGSTNNFPVDFITNNVKRMSLTSTGNLRINSDQSSIQFPNPGATPKPMMFIYESGNINTSRMVLAYSPAFPNYGLRYNGFDKFDFTNGGSTALNVDLTNSRIGVGTSLPKSRLHVLNGSSGASPFSLSSLTVEGSTSNYVNILAPSSSETGILFGHNTNNISGGVIYNNPGTVNGLQFRTNGNVTRMILSKDGHLNVGPGSTDDYRVRIDHSSELGLDIANSNSGTDWEIFAGSGGLNLFVDGGIGGPKGIFNRSTGAYSALSDERAKTNIKPMVSVLRKISQLKPASYQYKNAKDQQEYDGFIAQEVMKVFPSLVTHNVDAERKVDMYLLNYSGFGVIAVKAIQELMKINEEKDTKIDNLQKQIDELKAVVFKGAQSSIVADAKIKTTLTDALLEQNAPNPFTNTTTIRYTIPQKFTTAQLVIHDNNGKVIKQVKISDTGKGSVNVDASALSAGTYTYSLVVDGKTIGTKQMMLSK